MKTMDTLAQGFDMAFCATILAFYSQLGGNLPALPEIPSRAAAAQAMTQFAPQAIQQSRIPEADWNAMSLFDKIDNLSRRPTAVD